MCLCPSVICCLFYILGYFLVQLEAYGHGQIDMCIFVIAVMGVVELEPTVSWIWFLTV